MPKIYRPCYCTREAVARAMVIGLAGYDFSKIDRGVQAGAEAVDRLCKRVFFVTQTTHKFDWPNYQFAYPWRLWLENMELAAPPTQVVSGTYLASPVDITANVIPQPVNEGPPFTNIELRRDRNSAFGNNTTPQNDIGITGLFGYWNLSQPAGTITNPMVPGDPTVLVSSGASPGVGDSIMIDNERMIVIDSTFMDTGVTFSSGITTAQVNDNVGVVSNGAAFSVDEQILVDQEWMLIQSIFGNNLILKRAFSGSILNTHLNTAHIWARRQVSLLRGSQGTTAASHLANAPIQVQVIPSLVETLAIAEAVVDINQVQGGFAGGAAGLGSGAAAGVSQNQTGDGEAKEPSYGASLPDLRQRVREEFGRQLRMAVI